jgi:SdrD B-like domain
MARNARLALESLDERLVPSVTVLNVTTYGAVATAPSGAVVEQEATPLYRGHTDAGSLRSFLALDANGVEQGFNSGANNGQLDALSQGTRSLTLSQIPVVTQNGVAYREFLLGINEPNRAPYISLDELRLYTASAGNLTGYNANTKKLGGQSPIFDLDSAGDVSFKLNAHLDRGNGVIDDVVLIPNSVFVGTNANSFVYLYSKFGVLNPAQGGIEQWFTEIPPASPPPPPPPPATGSISGEVFFDSNNNQTLDSGESGQNMVSVTLTGSDSQNNPVNMSVTTGTDGSFSFTGLAAGTYTLTEQPLPGYENEFATAGTVAGSTDGSTTFNSITNIVLTAGQTGTGYIFGNVLNND